jgi:CheY-like chemotaxis protein
MRILIVEDEVLVAMMLTDSLESGGCPEHGYTGRVAAQPGAVTDWPCRVARMA